MNRLRRRRSDDGAVAIMMSVFVIIMVVLAAFVVDFGAAYVSKRQLQTASDAAALAAASVYAGESGTCPVLVGDPVLRDEAQAAADDYRELNRPAAVGSPIAVECNAEGELEVSDASAGDTDVVFGKVASSGDTITTNRSATAVVEVPPAVTEGLRPLMLCSNKLPAGMPSVVTKISGPSQGSAPPVVGCDGASNPGNWWFVDCFEGEPNGVLVPNILNGCSEPITIVPNQPSGDPGAHLRGYCSGVLTSDKEGSCLGASPGAAGNNLANAFDQLISEKEELFMPVFCGQPECDPAGVVGAGGNNAIYPVYRLVALTVCGYRFNNHTGEVDWTDQENIGRCAVNPSGLTAENAGVKGENYLLVVFHRVQTSGSVGRAECALGDDTCDGGARRVRLTE